MRSSLSRGSRADAAAAAAAENVPDRLPLNTSAISNELPQMDVILHGKGKDIDASSALVFFTPTYHRVVSAPPFLFLLRGFFCNGRTGRLHDVLAAAGDDLMRRAGNVTVGLTNGGGVAAGPSPISWSAIAGAQAGRGFLFRFSDGWGSNCSTFGGGLGESFGTEGVEAGSWAIASAVPMGTMCGPSGRTGPL